MHTSILDLYRSTCVCGKMHAVKFIFKNSNQILKYFKVPWLKFIC